MNSTTSTEPSQSLTEETKNNLIQKGLVLEQLLTSGKFLQFFQMNYDLVHVDEEDGTKNLYVVEVPDDVAFQRAQDALKQQVKAAPLVVPATEADLKKLGKSKK